MPLLIFYHNSWCHRHSKAKKSLCKCSKRTARKVHSFSPVMFNIKWAKHKADFSVVKEEYKTIELLEANQETKHQRT